MTIAVAVQLPWFWREYVGFLMFVQMLGFEVDTRAAARFLVRHSKVTVGGVYA